MSLRKFVTLVGAVVAVWPLWASAQSPVLPTIVAQGSTGGTIGKKDKAVSGAEAASPAPVARKPKEGKASPCTKLEGVWGWFSGRDVTIKSNGTAATGSLTATWTCKDNQIVMVWSHGFIDRLTLSADGQHLSGSNGIVKVSGHRK